MWCIANSNFTLSLLFTVNSVPVIPDVSSCSLVLRDGSGTTLHTYGSGDIPAVSTQYELLIVSGYNGLTSSPTPENRFATLSYTVDGKQYQQQLSYGVSPFIPTTVNPEKVRALLGLSPEELPDEDVDAISAYYYLLDKNSNFSTYLTTAGVKSMKANEAITVQAALNLVTSIPQRIAQTIKDEASQFSRPSKLDPYKLQDQLKEQLNELLDGLAAVAVETLTALPKFIVTARTDAFTGA